MDNVMDVVLNAKECAAYLKTSYFTLTRRAKAGELPSFKMGRRVMFRKSSIDAWIEAQEKGTPLPDSVPVPGTLRRIQ